MHESASTPVIGLAAPVIAVAAAARSRDFAPRNATPEAIARIAKALSAGQLSLRAIARAEDIGLRTLAAWIPSIPELTRANGEGETIRAQQQRANLGRVKAFLLDGRTRAQIAEALSVTKPTVGRWIVESEDLRTAEAAGLARRTGAARAKTAAGRGQLLLEAGRLFREGASSAQIALALGVSRTWVRTALHDPALRADRVAGSAKAEARRLAETIRWLDEDRTLAYIGGQQGISGQAVSVYIQGRPKAAAAHAAAKARRHASATVDGAPMDGTTASS